MRKTAALALCALMLAGPAAAEDFGYEDVDVEDVDHTVGWITGVDELTDEIFLDDGRAFVVLPHINFEMLSPGARVMLVFRATPAGRKIEQILPLPPFDTPARPRGSV